MTNRWILFGCEESNFSSPHLCSMALFERRNNSFAIGFFSTQAHFSGNFLNPLEVI